MEMPVPIHSSTPYSADSEGSVLREFVNAQERDTQATRLSQDVSANENVILPSGSTVQSPKSVRTQNFTEPQIRESGSIRRISTSTIPFPTTYVDPATSQGSVQEPEIGIQGQQDQCESFANLAKNMRLNPVNLPRTHKDPINHCILNSSQIPRDLVDAQEQLSPESRLHNPYERRTSASIRGEAHPRSSRAFQKSRAVDVADPGPSRRRSRQHSRSYNEDTISGVTATDEVVRQLKEQKKETSTLRRALRLAAERMDAESQRTVTLERGNVQAVEQFLTLNESRLAAQQEALKAGTELRVYQFQLENARREIERAQDIARTLENQRHEAEEAASRSRAELRKHAQAHLVAAAKEEGRRLGFEAGLRRAKEEVYLDSRYSRTPGSRVHEVTALPPHFELEHAISSPVRQRTSTRRAQVPGNYRETSPPPPHPRIQSPTPPPSAASIREARPPRAPQPQPQPASDINRAASPGPSVLRYAVSIPPASEIEQQPNQVQQVAESSQPWVTAHEYHQITGTQPSPENINQAYFPNPSRNVVTFAPAPLQENRPKKQSWFRRTLTRPWRKAPTVVPEAEETPSSWYQPPSANPPPSVRVHGFAPGTQEPRRTHADHASVSTHFSQFDLVNPPSAMPGPSHPNPNQSTPSLAGSAARGKRRMRERTPLHVINEDPSKLNETLPPLGRDIPPFSPSMGQIRDLLGDARNGYSDPQVVEEWRRSSASPSIASVTEMSQSRAKPQSVRSGQSGPPRRRPAHLTVPPLLGPQATNQPSSSTLPGSSLRNSTLLGVSDVRPSLQRNPTSATVYGFTVEPPVRLIGYESLSEAD
ncbi:hypothetical protein C0992_007487 [Termitomyces sp. T32_za158]|nr:hypothetical protein C0992_007487 [Termitomyces sp. T32_za158]